MTQRPAFSERRGCSAACSAAVWLFGLVAAVLAWPGVAAAQAQIAKVRVGRHAGYDRIVIDLTDEAVGTYRSQDPAQIDIAAAPPRLEPATRRLLADIGVQIEPSLEGTRIRLDLDVVRSWSAFRLSPEEEYENPRVVLDVGPSLPSPPPEANPVAERPPLLEPASDKRGAEPVRPGVLEQLAEPEPEPEPRPEPDREPEPEPEPSVDDRETPPPERERIASPTWPAKPLEVQIREDSLRLRIAGIAFAGLPESGPSGDELLDIVLPISMMEDGTWQVAEGSPGVALRELVSSGAGGAVLHAGVLQKIVERVAARYAERGRYGTVVDIHRASVESVIESGGDLVVHITEADSGSE